MTIDISQEFLNEIKDIALRADSEIIRSKAINAMGYIGKPAVPHLKEVASLALTPEETNLASNWIVKIASDTMPQLTLPSIEKAEEILTEVRRPVTKQPVSYVSYTPIVEELKKGGISPELEPARESIVQTVGTLADMVGLCLVIAQSPIKIGVECLSWIPALLEGL